MGTALGIVKGIITCLSFIALGLVFMPLGKEGVLRLVYLLILVGISRAIIKGIDTA